MLTTLMTATVLATGVNIINEDAKIVPDDTAQYGGFGAHISLDGDVAVITSNGNDYYGLDAGMAWVFERNADGDFEQLQILGGSDIGLLDEFGYSVSLHGNLLAIGARFHMADGQVNSGAAYIFERGTDGLFTQTQKLVAPVATLDEAYGMSINTDGHRIVVGSNGADSTVGGAAYVYQLDVAGTWLLETTLHGDGVDGGDLFGRAVGVVGDRIAVSSPYFAAGCGGTDLCGSVFVFEHDGTSWSQSARLVPNDLANEDYFGIDMELGEDRLLASSVYDDDMGIQSGSGYMFELDGGNWVQTAKFVAPDGQPQDFAGFSARMDGDRVVLGGWYGNDGRGAAWIWSHDESTGWAFEAEAQASDGHGFDIFGRAVAIDGDTLLVGADWADVDGHADAGAVYAYALGPREGACCTNGICVLSSPQLCSYFGGLYAGDDTDCDANDCGSCSADINHDGAVTVDDLLMVISQFGPCP
jgi:hypothetical protein